MMGISNGPHSAAAATTLRRSKSDPTPMRVWDRDNASGPPTLTDDQWRAHESTSEQLSMACKIVNAEPSRSGNSLAESNAAGHAEAAFQDGVSPPPDPDARTEHQEAPSAGRTRRLRWTAALLGVNGAQGALETFAGRVVEAGVRTLSRHQSRHEVNDSAMAAHAAVNVVMGLIAGARAGVHTWRGIGNPEAYRRGLFGERSEHSAALGIAGTPDVPASQTIRLLPSVAAAFLTFGAAAHTGMNALSHLGSSSNDKVNAYEAVVRSNANTAYCYTREVVNFVAHVFQLVSHDALLTPSEWTASTAEYGCNLAAQSRIWSDIDQGRSLDLRWPAISAVAEAVDVAFTSATARLGEPDRPVEIWRGCLAEGTAGERHPPPRPTVIDTIDRVTQRAVGRQLVGEICHSVQGIGPVLAAGTHLRELTWQAERASRDRGNTTPPSDLETPSPAALPNAGTSSGPLTPRQEATELPSAGDLNAGPPDIAGPSSSS